MQISTDNLDSIKQFVNNFFIPDPRSHKGQNGKVLIIGGSKLFHASSIWSAEVASHFVDIVHFSSTKENNEIFLAVKKNFRSGMVIARHDLEEYLKEDDCILIGPGMVRTEGLEGKKEEELGGLEGLSHFVEASRDKDGLDKIEDEGMQTYYFTKYILSKFPDKKYVIDAGALQMMNPEWLLQLKEKAILTPHQKEFQRVFHISIETMTLEEKMQTVLHTAQKYNCVILLKAIDDIISDGQSVYVIKGGNAGLTKGGSGDVLAGLTAAFYSKNKAIISSILASFCIKKAADNLFQSHGYWFNINDLIEQIPQIIKKIAL